MATNVSQENLEGPNDVARKSRKRRVTADEIDGLDLFVKKRFHQLNQERDEMIENLNNQIEKVREKISELEERTESLRESLRERFTASERIKQ